MTRRLFLPGWGAPSAIYVDALAPAWQILDSPSFARSGGHLRGHMDRLLAEIDAAEDAVVLGGHSMGGALAVLAAVRRPEKVARIVLVAPAGLPLSKPMWRCLVDFFRAVGQGRYPRRLAAQAVAGVVAAPRSAFRLAREVRALDLHNELAALRELGIPCSVVGCTSDTLTPPALCRRIARLVGARYRELDVPGGHTWMLGQPGLLRRAVRS